MPWIRAIDEANADATLKEAYSKIKGSRGKSCQYPENS